MEGAARDPDEQPRGTSLINKQFRPTVAVRQVLDKKASEVLRTLEASTSSTMPGINGMPGIVALRRGRQRHRLVAIPAY